MVTTTVFLNRELPLMGSNRGTRASIANGSNHSSKRKKSDSSSREIQHGSRMDRGLRVGSSVPGVVFVSKSLFKNTVVATVKIPMFLLDKWTWTNIPKHMVKHRQAAWSTIIKTHCQTSSKNIVKHRQTSSTV
jgi:hypothetical protein